MALRQTLAEDGQAQVGQEEKYILVYKPPTQSPVVCWLSAGNHIGTLELARAAKSILDDGLPPDRNGKYTIYQLVAEK